MPVASFGLRPVLMVPVGVVEGQGTVLLPGVAALGGYAGLAYAEPCSFMLLSEICFAVGIGPLLAVVGHWLDLTSARGARVEILPEHATVP